MTDEAIVARRARLEMSASWRKMSFGHIGFGALVTIAYGAGARLFLDTDAALLALACCGGLYGGSIVLGLGCAALVAPAHRPAAAAIWLRGVAAPPPVAARCARSSHRARGRGA